MLRAAAIACCLLASAAPVLADWPTYQGNPAHTGYVPGTYDVSNSRVLWTSNLGVLAPQGLAVGDSTIFVTSGRPFGPTTGSLYALDQGTGIPLWNQTYPSGIGLTAPAYANGTVYFQVNGRYTDTKIRLQAYTAHTGSQIYSAHYDAQGYTYLSPTPYNGNIYVGGGQEGGLYSFNGATGQQNWWGYIADYDWWTPAVDSQYCYAYTGPYFYNPSPGEFRIIDRATGNLAYLIQDPNFVWGGYAMNSAVVLGSTHDAFSFSAPVNASPGRLIKWDIQADATHTPHIAWVLSDKYNGQPTLANGVLYANDGGTLAALDEETGQTLWTWTPPVGTSLSGTMIATDNLLFLCTSTSAFYTPPATYALDLNTHAPVWSFPQTGILALSDNTLYIASSNDNVFAIGVPEPAALSGDADGDGTVSFADYQILEANYGTGTTWAQGDFNGDHAVTFADYQILEANFGKSSVPEPATLSLLALGGLALLRKRR